MIGRCSSRAERMVQNIHSIANITQVASIFVHAFHQLFNILQDRLEKFSNHPRRKKGIGKCIDML